MKPRERARRSKAIWIVAFPFAWVLAWSGLGLLVATIDRLLLTGGDASGLTWWFVVVVLAMTPMAWLTFAFFAVAEFLPGTSSEVGPDRCGACGYDLRGLSTAGTELRCPECSSPKDPD